MDEWKPTASQQKDIREKRMGLYRAIWDTEVETQLAIAVYRAREWQERRGVDPLPSLAEMWQKCARILFDLRPGKSSTTNYISHTIWKSLDNDKVKRPRLRRKKVLQPITSPKWEIHERDEDSH